MYYPQHFIVQEFVTPKAYLAYGQSSWRFINIGTVKIAEFLRNYFDAPIYINTWHSKLLIRRIGLRKESGYRNPSTKTGSDWSAHKRGMAIDIKVKGIDAPEVQAEIIKNYDCVFKGIGITAIELNTPTWTHITNENWQSDELKLISFYKKPKKKPNK